MIFDELYVVHVDRGWGVGWRSNNYWSDGTIICYTTTEEEAKQKVQELKNHQYLQDIDCYTDDVGYSTLEEFNQTNIDNKIDYHESNYEHSTRDYY